MDGGSSWAVYQYYQYLSLDGTRDGITRGDGSSIKRRITIAAANFITCKSFKSGNGHSEVVMTERKVFKVHEASDVPFFSWKNSR